MKKYVFTSYKCIITSSSRLYKSNGEYIENFDGFKQTFLFNDMMKAHDFLEHIFNDHLSEYSREGLQTSFSGDCFKFTVPEYISIHGDCIREWVFELKKLDMELFYADIVAPNHNHKVIFSSIASLDLPKRIYNILMNHNIDTTIKLEHSCLEHIDGIGPKSIKLINERLEEIKNEY